MIHSQSPQRKSHNLLRCPNELHESLEFTSDDEKDAVVLINNSGLNSGSSNISIMQHNGVQEADIYWELLEEENLHLSAV